jgi:large conductance mechanosensitive channel
MAGVAGLIGLDDVSQLAAGPLLYGRFLAALLSFVIIASVLFVLIKAAARLDKPPVAEAPVPDSDEVMLLREIRDLLTARASGSPGEGGLH